MRLSLRAGERVYINGAVLRVDRKVGIELLNDATFLLEGHVLQAEEATTPLRQLYFAVQTMLIAPAEEEAARDLYAGLRAGILPAVRLQIVSKVPIYSYAGRIGLTPYRVQIDCLGPRYGDAKMVARAVEAVVAGLTRPAWDACFLEAERDDDDTDAAGNPVHRTFLDFRIWHQS